MFGALFQPRVHRKRHLCHFVNRRGDRGRFAETVTRAEGLQFVGVHGVDDVVKQLAQLGIAVRVIAALQHPVHGIVKILACRFQVAGFEVLLPGRKSFLNLLDQVFPPSGNRRQQRDQRAAGRTCQRQRRESWRSLRLVRSGRRRQCWDACLDRLLPRVLAAHKACGEQDRARRDMPSMFHLPMVKTDLGLGQRFPSK